MFARDWAVGLALDNAKEWFKVFKGSIKVALVIVILERIGLVGGESWLEMHLDALSIQAVLLRRRGATTFAGDVGAFLDFTARLEMKQV